jgi:hypothetical protein
MSAYSYLVLTDHHDGLDPCHMVVSCFVLLRVHAVLLDWIRATTWLLVSSNNIDLRLPDPLPARSPAASLAAALAGVERLPVHARDDQQAVCR